MPTFSTTKRLLASRASEPSRFALKGVRVLNASPYAPGDDPRQIAEISDGRVAAVLNDGFSATGVSDEGVIVAGDALDSIRAGEKKRTAVGYHPSDARFPDVASHLPELPYPHDAKIVDSYVAVAIDARLLLRLAETLNAGVMDGGEPTAPIVKLLIPAFHDENRVENGFVIGAVAVAGPNGIGAVMPCASDVHKEEVIGEYLYELKAARNAENSAKVSKMHADREAAKQQPASV